MGHTLNPKPYTLNPTPYTLNPKPEAPNRFPEPMVAQFEVWLGFKSAGGTWSYC